MKGNKDLPSDKKPGIAAANLLDACVSAMDMYRSTGNMAAVCKHPDGGYFGCFYDQKEMWELVCIVDITCEDAEEVYDLARKNLALEQE